MSLNLFAHLTDGRARLATQLVGAAHGRIKQRLNTLAELRQILGRQRCCRANQNARDQRRFEQCSTHYDDTDGSDLRRQIVAVANRGLVLVFTFSSVLMLVIGKGTSFAEFDLVLAHGSIVPFHLRFVGENTAPTPNHSDYADLTHLYLASMTQR